MTQRMAVDVVLLPPPEKMRHIAALTAHLPPDPTRLNTSSCLPHLSLAQGVLDQARQTEAEALLQAVAARHQQCRLSFLEARSYKVPDGRLFSQLVADLTDALNRLHRDVMDTFRSLLAPGEVTVDMFVSPPEVAEISASWTRGYYEKRDAEGFDPHITLGAGDVSLDEPLVFITPCLALCQLGTYCTCRKLLHEASLRQ